MPRGYKKGVITTSGVIEVGEGEGEEEEEEVEEEDTYPSMYYNNA